MSITIRTNIASLLAQRRLGQSTYALQQSFTRLSSGLRINKASDDAAGLAISESLKADARVFGQGIRNLNDAVSLLNIAESALTELSNMLTRQLELTEQAANGTLSLEQRLALTEEANALVEEFNRIVETTEFNDQQLLNLSVESLRIQAGYGENGSISFGLGSGLSRTVGDGTFTAANSFTLDGLRLESADLNGDGQLDLVSRGTDDLYVLLGNGNGTFQSPTSIPAPNAVDGVFSFGDFNQDGILDIAAPGWAGQEVSIFLGNGNGTFKAELQHHATLPGVTDIAVGDLNNDGIEDLAVGAGAALDRYFGVLLGNGDGSFQAVTSYFLMNSGNGSMPPIALGDFDGDGSLDLSIVLKETDQHVKVFLNNGDGTFRFSTNLETTISPVGAGDVISRDFNFDGFFDLAVATENEDSVRVFLSNGDGTFEAKKDYYYGGGNYRIVAEDFNGDGIYDLMTTNNWNDTISIHLGNRDGTFTSDRSFAAADSGNGLAVGDFNGDGALDAAVLEAAASELTIHEAGTQEVTSAPYLWLLSREGALEEISVLKAELERVTSELGAIGAVQSRMETAVRTLQQTRENYLSARSQIVDADVAHEAAELVKKRILQQAGAAILAQANQSPELALLLLNGP